MPKLPQDPYHLVSAALNFHVHLRHGDTPLSSIIALVFAATSLTPPREVSQATSPAAATVPLPCVFAGFEYLITAEPIGAIIALSAFHSVPEAGPMDRRRRRKEPRAGSADAGRRSLARTLTAGVASARIAIRAPELDLISARR